MAEHEPDNVLIGEGFMMASLSRVMGLAVLIAAGVGGSAGSAADRAALALAQMDYRYLEDVRRPPSLGPMYSALGSAGFEMNGRADGNQERVLRTFGKFVDTLDPVNGDVAIVYLSGHFVTTGTETYLLTRDMRAPTDIAGLLREALPLSAVLTTLADYPGRSALVLAHSGLSGPSGPRTKFGLGDLNIPNGVMVAHGSARNATDFIGEVLARPGVPMVAEARQRSMRLRGFVPRNRATFLDGGRSGSTAPQPDDTRPSVDEDKLWERVRNLDTIDAYNRYLRRFPNGKFADEAARLIEEIQTEPNRAARLAEEALGLSRDSRREIQRNLSILGFNTRGIDGIFGRGSRAAISSWQQRSGFDANGYLTGNQVARLSEQARVRAAELEEEARRKQEAEERQDRAFWEETGAFGDEEGFRSYLERYPDGLFADQARTELARIEERRKARAAARDRRRWDNAAAVGTVTAYREYLRDFPEGAFADEAKRRIAELDRDPAEVEAEKRAARLEQALGLDPNTRRLIEARLQQLRLEPGAVDGAFDDQTRRAIRRFQKSRSLPVTGYIDRGTVVRMLSDVFR